MVVWGVGTPGTSVYEKFIVMPVWVRLTAPATGTWVGAAARTMVPVNAPPGLTRPVSAIDGLVPFVYAKVPVTALVASIETVAVPKLGPPSNSDQGPLELPW